MGIGVHREEDRRGVGGRVGHKTIKPVRDNGKINVQVDAGKNKVARASIDNYHRTVPVAQVRDLLGFEGLGGVDRGPGIGEVPNHVGLLKETQGSRGVIKGRK